MRGMLQWMMGVGAGAPPMPRICMLRGDSRLPAGVVMPPPGRARRCLQAADAANCAITTKQLCYCKLCCCNILLQRVYCRVLSGRGRRMQAAEAERSHGLGAAHLTMFLTFSTSCGNRS